MYINLCALKNDDNILNKNIFVRKFLQFPCAKKNYFKSLNLYQFLPRIEKYRISPKKCHFTFENVGTY